jgi:hypothetical protein
MEERVPPIFPPPLIVGNRVWTVEGYHHHGPKGLKVDIAPNQGGTIIGTEKPYYTMDQMLYKVHWDNGQLSKHYYKGLFCIGRLQNRAEFDEAI